jgi:hypothetical protein
MVRDLALFNCAIDAKLRGCDLVRLRVSDVAPGGALRQRTTVIQQNKGRPVPFEITELTRDAVSAWLKGRGRRADDWLFTSRSRPRNHISTRQYARLLKDWLKSVDLEPRSYGTHRPAPDEGCTCLQEDRQPESTPAPAGVTPSLKALFAISGSRSMTRSRFPNRLNSEKHPRPKAVAGDFRYGWNGGLRLAPCRHRNVARRPASKSMRAG